MSKTIIILSFLALITGCSQYKSTWSCSNTEGIGCSSISYADLVARKHIILNDSRNHVSQRSTQRKQNRSPAQQNSKKVLIKEHYADFEYHPEEEVDIG